MMKKLSILLFALAAIVFIGCNNAKQKNAENVDASKDVMASENFYGTYEGTLPCADCPGIKTVLTINDDTTYELKSEYLEKEDGNFNQSGVYELAHDGKVLVLITPSSGEKIYYRILDSAVALTDETGALNEGELAEFYILKKK